jgi:S1-C subfamily serine protease
MDFAAAADGSILVESLVPDGPAARAGAALGDRIVAIEGAKIEGLAALREALKKLRPCLSCKVEVRRGEEAVTLEIQPWGRL